MHVFTKKDFLQHTLLLGRSGSGKTNTLIDTMRQLASPESQAKFPCSIIFIDPHGDAGLMLPQVMKDWSKLILLDPEHVPFALNPLGLLPYENEDEKVTQIQNQVSELVMILEDVMKTDIAKATRMTWIFRGSLYFLYALSPKITFLDLHSLMTDFMRKEKEDEIKEVFKEANIEDAITNSTIEAIAGLKDEAYTPIVNRIMNFVMPAGSFASRTFCSRETTVPFDKMLEPGYTTVIRLTKANLPNDFRDVITNSLVMKIFFLIQQRARRLEKEGKDPSARTPVFLVIDEFQTVEKLAVLETILSEARKFGLFLILAHQNLSQLSRKELQQSLLTNVGMLMVMQTGPDDAAVLSKVLGEGGDDYRGVLTKLKRGKVVMRRQPLGEPARTEIIMMARIPDPVHTQAEVFEFMRKEAETFPPPREDRNPIYKGALEELLKERGRPQASPGRWKVLTHLFYNASAEAYVSTVSYMHALFYDQQGWAKSVVDNLLRELQDLHYVGMKEAVGRVIDREDVSGNPMWRAPKPSIADEMERARTYQCWLTDIGREKFFPRHVPKSQRAGTTLHVAVMEKLIREYQEKGYWVTGDWGEKHQKRPDLVVYLPTMRRTYDDRLRALRESWDTDAWDSKETMAIEIETNPRKNQKQLRKNYDKCTKAWYGRVIFAVTMKEHVEDVQRILYDKDPESYTILPVNTGLSMEQMKKALSEEARTPVEDWVQQAPGDGKEDVRFLPNSEIEATTPDESAPQVENGPLGEIPVEAYQRLPEILRHFQTHGMPVLGAEALRQLATNPNWKEDPIWKVAESKSEQKARTESVASKNLGQTNALAPVELTPTDLPYCEAVKEVIDYFVVYPFDGKTANHLLETKAEARSLDLNKLQPMFDYFYANRRPLDDFLKSHTERPDRSASVQMSPVGEVPTAGMDNMDHVIKAVRKAVFAGDGEAVVMESLKAGEILRRLEGDTSPEAEAERAKWRAFGREEFSPGVVGKLKMKGPEPLVSRGAAVPSAEAPATPVQPRGNGGGQSSVSIWTVLYEVGAGGRHERNLIAAATGLSTRQTSRHLQKLVEMGMLTISRKKYFVTEDGQAAVSKLKDSLTVVQKLD